MRLPTKPPLSLKHREERLKLGATALQNFALALSLGVLVIPALTGQRIAPIQALTVAFITAGIAEFLAFTLLRYIPSQPSPQETAMVEMLEMMFFGLAVAGASGGACYLLWRHLTGGP